MLLTRVMMLKHAVRPKPRFHTSHSVRAVHYRYQGVVTQRFFSFTSLPKFLFRVTKIPAAVGGSLAAGGTYVAYKVEQASTYTQDKLASARDLLDGVIDSTSDFFRGFRTSSDAESSETPSDDAGAVVGVAAAVGLTAEEEEEEEEDDDETDSEMLTLTRLMIEIRQILQTVDQSDTLKLPSIVVVGSQSSGKSSVLESIVGKHFLPKGSNMVTRRPIELTLINTPDSAAEVADFPALRMNNITDFDQVRKLLFDMNMAVPVSEAILNDPIQLTIRSPHVPDLTLVDLPGYIQVEAADQPTALKQKIREVCDKYLQAPNIILAISAADVDLANSSALKASKDADPRGERTIGVITKLDLIDPEQGRDMLLNKKYPLKMGYVGVVTKPPTSTSLFRRGVASLDSQINSEAQYFKAHKEVYQGTHLTTVGVRSLKRKLMKVLEKLMAMSLRPTHYAIQQELEEAAYTFKVEFNDRQLTPGTYLANNIDALKLSVKEFSQSFGRNELRSLLKNQLDQKVLNLLAERYWNKPFEVKHELSVEPDLSDLPRAQDEGYWHRKLDLATSSLTTSGVGRLSTTLISNALLTEIDNLVNNTDLRNHPLAQKQVREAATAVLGARFYLTADQVENCIKPYKYEIELEDREWSSSRDHALVLLKEEMRQCLEASAHMKKVIGGRKLTQVITYLEQKEAPDSTEALGFSPTLLAKGREAIFLRDRANLLKMRHYALKSSTCKFKENKYKCPEIFLDAVSQKLSSTAILFLNVELLSDFYYNFPRELDYRFFTNMTPEQIEVFAKEDPKIKRHVELQQRKELLEEALQKIESVIALQRTKINSLTGGVEPARKGVFGAGWR
ncbi:hypothetical protein BABINDRAFT_160945 [Babjeviella inositovora NRRL Y-12698]|uniref:dynamin GTPase n=1 Tax=Babjeviella inositovora NRRL Y-12698 TaxID=984486 RepID=A0A1E3QSS5_9ASCO|nr:uncharacterized protein BABINDRAFT_160945 [Babjeviella inositovora NRRL Y-12698]ODQ80720.1 hypothetical protein BABINDRAFT_160945 [Babjeviella inositovora NRRL Y-12698]